MHGHGEFWFPDGRYYKGILIKYFKGIGLRIKKKDKENFIIPIDLYMQGNGRITNRMDMESLLITMEK